MIGQLSKPWVYLLPIFMGHMTISNSPEADAGPTETCSWTLQGDVNYFAAAAPETMVAWTILNAEMLVGMSEDSARRIASIEDVSSKSSRWFLLQDAHVESSAYNVFLYSEDLNGDWREFRYSHSLNGISVNDVPVSAELSIPEIVDLIVQEVGVDYSQSSLGLRDGSVTYVGACVSGQQFRSAVYGMDEGFSTSEFPNDIDGTKFDDLSSVARKILTLSEQIAVPPSTATLGGG